MKLLERDDDLQLLAAALEEAVGGHGRIALVSGEAGIGKTAFVDCFMATCNRAIRILKGNCDGLFTPSPLGPLYDIARQTGGTLLARLESETPRTALFSAMLDQLRDPAQATLLVIEDIHWADEATLDLLRYLARRIAQAKVLIVLTYRDDENDAQHLLRPLLGDLATSQATVRIELRRLTIEAVRTLIADAPLDADALHGQTSGNAFFVTEVLCNAGRGIPTSVRDAVLARAAKLGEEGRKTLEAAAVIGSRIKQELLERMLGGDTEGLADCVDTGMLEAAGDDISFRHELARQAVLDDIDPLRQRELNRLALVALKGARPGRDRLAQLARFAEGACDSDAVLAYGPAAARAAASVGAHRAAVDLYRRALAFAGDRGAGEQARLLEAYAEECEIVDELAEAIRAHREAIDHCRRVGDRLKEGENLAALAWPLVRSGQNAAAEEASREAIAVLESMPPTRQLAAAYRIQAHLRMLDRDKPLAVRWGKKAIELATRFDDQATLAAAEIVVGSAMLVAGDEKGADHLDRSLALAHRAGLDPLIGLAHSNLGSAYGELFQFSKAERHLAEGIAFAGDCDLDHAYNYMNSWLALTRLYQGRWSEASDIAASVICCGNASVISRIMALVALGRVRARRGDPGAAAALDEALELALQTDTLQRLAPVRAARAEAAWLAGDCTRTAIEATAISELALRHRHRWHAGESAFWRWRAGEKGTAPKWAAAPFVLQIKGDWRRAAEAWEKLGCPYEQARALGDGNLAAQLEALEIYDELGAAPAAAALRQHMRGAGVRRIPRGPRASTRENPFGLTRREMEILSCLAGGLSNRVIGTQLHVSPKTVDHHVSSVLGKLGATSRVEAARIAREKDLLPKNGEDLATK